MILKAKQELSSTYICTLPQSPSIVKRLADFILTSYHSGTKLQHNFSIGATAAILARKVISRWLVYAIVRSLIDAARYCPALSDRFPVDFWRDWRENKSTLTRLARLPDREANALAG
jgi:ribosomal protein S17E